MRILIVEDDDIVADAMSGFDLCYQLALRAVK